MQAAKSKLIEAFKVFVVLPFESPGGPRPGPQPHPHRHHYSRLARQAPISRAGKHICPHRCLGTK